DRLDHSVDPTRRLPTLERRAMEAKHERLRQGLVGIAEAHIAHAALGPGDEQAPERTRAHGVADRAAACTRARLARRHTEFARGAVVEATTRRVAGREDCGCHRACVREERLRSLRQCTAAVFLRRDASLALEEALEVVRTEPERFGDCVVASEALRLFEEATR